MIATANKYSTVRSAVQPVPPKTLSARRSARVFVPNLTGARQCLKDWYWREIKEGGYLSEYLQSEKRRTPEMIRRVARIMHGFQQNNKSDFRRLCTIPARLYQRWKREDQHFFEDDDNLRSLKRDNPDLPIYVPPRQLPTGTFRKRYPTLAP